MQGRSAAAPRRVASLRERSSTRRCAATSSSSPKARSNDCTPPERTRGSACAGCVRGSAGYVAHQVTSSHNSACRNARSLAALDTRRHGPEVSGSTPQPVPRYGNHSKGVTWISAFRSAGSASPPASTGSSRRRHCPTRASSRRPSGTASTRSSTTSRPATGSCSHGATSCSRASTTGTASTPARPTPEAYTAFLREIGYLLDEPAEVAATTSDVDDEVARIAGPQLVVPLLNARFATNAVNARWGSLYDALYGSDVVPHEGDLAPGEEYNKVRGDEVIARGRAFLDEHFPLDGGSHADASSYAVDGEGLAVTVKDDVLRLADPAQLVGYRGAAEAPEAVLLVHHGLHVEIQVDPDDSIGATDDAGVKDLLLEAAVSTIMDLEDSVAAVDAEDKVLGYRNWKRLMEGTLAEEVTKGGETFTRAMNPDRTYTAPSGDEVTLPGRSLLFIRQVGHLMTTDAVLDRDGNEVPEGILDAVMTALGSLADLHGRSRAPQLPHRLDVRREAEDARAGRGRVRRRAVRPRRGAARPAPPDHQGRDHGRGAAYHASTSRPASPRPASGSPSSTPASSTAPATRSTPPCMAGPMVRKNDMKGETWIQAYEDLNVDIGLECGLLGRAQIGKGMWAAPDSLAAMMEAKIGHPEAGASCAWVPSPTAATLHALHYHQVDVRARQEELAAGRAPPRARRAAPRSPRRPGRLVGRGPAAGDRQQPAEPARVRRPLGRRRGRVLQGARHHRRAADGGPGHLPDLLAARRQLAAPRRRHRRAGRGDPAPDGQGRRRAERRRLVVHPDGAGLRRRRLRGRPGAGLRGPRAAQRLHRADPAPPPRPQEVDRRSSS